MKRLLLIASLLYLAGAARADVVGDSAGTIGSSCGEQPFMSRLTAGADGTIDSISVYLGVQSTGYPAQFFVYRVSDSALIDTTARTNMNTLDTGWVTMATIEGASISASTEYMVGAWADFGYTVWLNISVGDGVWYKGASWASALPNPMTAPTAQTGWSIGAKMWYTQPAPSGPPDVRHEPAGVGIHHSVNGGSVRHRP